MRLRNALMALVMVLTLALMPAAQLNAADPPGPVQSYLIRTPGIPLPDPFEVVTTLIKGAPGASNVLHTHPSLLVVTVLGGQLTFVSSTGQEKIYKAGDTFTEIVGVQSYARNNGTEPFSAWLTAIVPKGTPFLIPVPGAAPPAIPLEIVYQTRVAGKPFTGDYELVTYVNDLVPGALSTLHTHGGQLLVTVIQGELTFRVNGVDTVYKAGQTLEEIVGVFGQPRNAGTTPTRVLVASLLPKGQVLTTVAPVAAPALPLPNTGLVDASALTFLATGFSLSGPLLDFWKLNGDLAVFGYPIDSERASNGQVFQWFERNRLELHPENSGPYSVLLGRLGAETLAKQGVDWQKLPALAAAPASCRLFTETGHSLCGDFLNYWQSNGLEFDGVGGKSYAESLALFGYPLSEPTIETNSSGDRVLTQWFERARFEFHPDNPVSYRVLLGRLGAELK